MARSVSRWPPCAAGSISQPRPPDHSTFPDQQSPCIRLGGSAGPASCAIRLATVSTRARRPRSACPRPWPAGRRAAAAGCAYHSGHESAAPGALGSGRPAMNPGHGAPKLSAPAGAGGPARGRTARRPRAGRLPRRDTHAMTRSALGSQPSTSGTATAPGLGEPAQSAAPPRRTRQAPAPRSAAGHLGEHVPPVGQHDAVVVHAVLPAEPGTGARRAGDPPSRAATAGPRAARSPLARLPRSASSTASCAARPLAAACTSSKTCAYQPRRRGRGQGPRRRGRGPSGPRPDRRPRRAGSNDRSSRIRSLAAARSGAIRCRSARLLPVHREHAGRSRRSQDRVDLPGPVPRAVVAARRQLRPRAAGPSARPRASPPCPRSPPRPCRPGRPGRARSRSTTSAIGDRQILPRHTRQTRYGPNG